MQNLLRKGPACGSYRCREENEWSGAAPGLYKRDFARPPPPPPPRPGPMDDTAAAAGHRRALRGDGTRNNRRFGRTRRGAAGWETLSGRTAGRRAEVSWAARGAERWARGDGDVCATNAPRPPSPPRPLPVPSSSPPRPQRREGSEKRDACQHERAEQIGAAIEERHSPYGAPADDTAARLCRMSLPRSGSH